MRVGYPLGLPRRPGRVGDESQVVLPDLRPVVHGRKVLQPLVPTRIEAERLRPFGQTIHVPLLREDDPRARIGHDVGEQGRRVGELEHQIGAAGLHGGEAGDHVLGTPLHVNTDGFVRAYVLAPQIRRKPVGEIVQLTVGQGDVLVFQRDILRRAARLLLEELVQAAVSRVLRPRHYPSPPKPCRRGSP